MRAGHTCPQGIANNADTASRALVNGRRPCHRTATRQGGPTMSTRHSAVVFLVIVALITGLASSATPADPIKVAFVDPLSGPFAATGENGLNQMKYAADGINKAGGVLGRQIEIVPLDNKVSPQESLIQLKKVIGDGIQFVFQGNSSGVAHAISDAVLKHNERNPGGRVLYLNYSAVDPALTNEKCHFWHFRFDAHADMKT